MSPRPVLIVDDDPDICQVLVEQLSESQQFSATVVSTVADADQAIQALDAEFEAIVLDVKLPDGDGLAFCANLRKRGNTLPIILLTGLNGEADVVSGFAAGADDYLIKPFRISELLARLRVQMRSLERSENARWTIGPYTFHPAKKILQDAANKRRIRLTDKESNILKHLYQAGTPVSRLTLLQEVWGYNPSASTHTLETHIYRLRQKLEPVPGQTCLLMTENGGYRLAASLPAATPWV